MMTVRRATGAAKKQGCQLGTWGLQFSSTSSRTTYTAVMQHMGSCQPDRTAELDDSDI